MSGIDWTALRDGPVSARTLRLTLRTGDAALQGSSGEVRDASELYSEALFGPDLGRTCPCGATTALPSSDASVADTSAGAPRASSTVARCPRCEHAAARDVRIERFAHIALAAPVLHPWLLDAHPSPVARVLELTQSQLLAVCEGRAHLVTHAPEGAPHRAGTALTPIQARAARALHPGFATATFAPALQTRWSALDRDERPARPARTRGQRVRALARGQRVRALARGRWLQRLRPWPASILLTHIPVAPPGLRGPDPRALDERYARVLAANARMKLDPTDAAQRDLWLAVRALFLGGERLAQGRRASLRRTLRAALRARRDAVPERSAQCVLAPDPRLALDECALPVALAAELLALPACRALLDARRAPNLWAARRMLQPERPAALDVLERLLRAQPVVVAHRSVREPAGVRAFAATLCEGRALRVHPARCAALGGADALVSVRLPASTEARRDAWRIARAPRPLVAAESWFGADTAPTVEALLGLYHATFSARDELPAGPARAFASLAAVVDAYERGAAQLREVVVVRLEATWSADDAGDDEQPRERVRTTVGRALVGALLPPALPFALVNQVLHQRALRALFAAARASSPPGVIDAMSARLWSLGLALATRAGFSLGLDDLRAPAEKPALLAAALEAVAAVEAQYSEGMITGGERSNKVVDLWAEARDRIASAWREPYWRRCPAGEGRAAGYEATWHPLHAQADAGAGAAMSSLATLVAMGGLRARGSGEVIEVPAVRSLAEGLSPHEFALTALSGRAHALRDEGRSERALGLQHRLARALAHVKVTEDDCGTRAGRLVQPPTDGDMLLIPLRDLAVGRVLSRDARALRSGAVLLAAGAWIDARGADALERAGVREVEVRWPVGCASRRGVCRRCYGRPGQSGAAAAAGLDAAFALGAAAAVVRERSFGLWAGSFSPRSRIERATRDARVRFRGVQVRALPSERGALVLSCGGQIVLEHDDGRTSPLRVRPGDLVYVADGARIESGALVLERNAWSGELLAEIPPGARARVEYVGLVPGRSLVERPNEVTGLSESVAVVAMGAPAPALRLVPTDGDEARWEPVTIPLTHGAVLRVGEGALVVRDDPLLNRGSRRWPTWEPAQRRAWWQSGIDYLEDLLAARCSWESSPVAPAEGVLRWVDDNTVFEVWSESGERLARVRAGAAGRYFAPSVFDGEWVERGETVLLGGAADPHELLAAIGPERFAEQLTEDLFAVCATTWPTVASVHLELVVRAMLSRATVLDAGDTGLLVGDTLERAAIAEANERAAASGGRAASYQVVLTGI